MRKFYTPEAVTEGHAEPGPRGKHLPFRCQTTAFTGVKVFESLQVYVVYVFIIC